MVHLAPLSAYRCAMITDPFFYLCAIPAVLLYGIAKGGFGGNIAIVSVPLMALVEPPRWLSPGTAQGLYLQMLKKR